MLDLRPKVLFSLVVGGILLIPGVSVKAQVVLTPSTPQVGSGNPVSPEPSVPRPSHTQPCTVQLFQNLEFADYNVKSFNYAPPAGCAGPWEKVVFTADFTMTAGNQFDRTAQFSLGTTNLYFGTTAEPTQTLSPSWHVESDVTDLSALLKSAQTGSANLGNFVGVSNGVTYNGIIYGNAQLVFYPVKWGETPPKTPNVVIGLGNSFLNTTTDQLSQTLTLPPHRIESRRTLMYCRRASPTMSSGTSACPMPTPPNSIAAATPGSAKPRSASTASLQVWLRFIRGSIRARMTRLCGCRRRACRHSTSSPTAST